MMPGFGRLRVARGLLRDIFSTSVLNTVGKAAGLLIPFFIAAWFGAGRETDTFFLAYGILLFVNGAFSLAVENVMVPFVGRLLVGGLSLEPFVAGVIRRGGTGLGLFLLLLLGLAWPLLPLIHPRGVDARFLVVLLLEIAPMAVLTFIASVVSGVMYVRRQFALPALSPLLRAVVTLAVAAGLRRSLGIHAVIVGYLAGETARLAGLLAASPMRAIRVRKPAGKISAEVNRFFRVAGFQAGAMTALNFNSLVDRFMAAPLGAGQISLLHYADRIFTIPATFIIGGILLPILSHWSERFHQGGRSILRADLRRGVFWLGGFTVAVTAIGLLASDLLVNISLGSGRFSASDLSETASILRFYLLGLPPFALAGLYIRAHMVLQRTRMVLLATLGSILLNIVLNRLLLVDLGAGGIALATGLTNLALTAALHLSFLRACNAPHPPHGDGS